MRKQLTKFEKGYAACIIDLIGEEMGISLTVETLCKQAGVTTDEINEWIKIGLTPYEGQYKQWINQLIEYSKTWYK